MVYFLTPLTVFVCASAACQKRCWQRARGFIPAMTEERPQPSLLPSVSAEHVIPVLWDELLIKAASLITAVI